MQLCNQEIANVECPGLQVVSVGSSSSYAQVGLCINILGLENNETGANCLFFAMKPPAIGNLGVKVEKLSVPKRMHFRCVVPHRRIFSRLFRAFLYKFICIQSNNSYWSEHLQASDVLHIRKFPSKIIFILFLFFYKI